MENIVFVPLGSYEQHGKLLSNNTDTIISEFICNEVAVHYKRSTILPTISYGLSNEHMGIGKTITLSIDTYINLLRDILFCVPKSFPECKLVVFINGHGGNQNIATAFCEQNNYIANYPKAIVLHVFPESSKKLSKELLGDFNAHADSVESSVYAAITNELQDNVYSLNELGETPVKKKLLSLFPTRIISKRGIVTSSNSIVINSSVGRKILENSIMSIVGDINKTIELLEEI